MKCSACGKFKSAKTQCKHCKALFGKTPMEKLRENSIPIPESGCLVWLGAASSDGYGTVSVNNRMKRVHRLAWELTYGPIPGGFCICHHCDVPLCINTDHLFIGTHADNMQDLANKGYIKNRQFSEVHRAKLSASGKKDWILRRGVRDTH